MHLSLQLTLSEEDWGGHAGLVHLSAAVEIDKVHMHTKG